MAGNTPEKSMEYWESVGWEYYGRFTQTRAFVESVLKETGEEFDSYAPQRRNLGEVLTLPPMFLKGMFPDISSILAPASVAARVQAKTRHVSNILLSLVNATCEPEVKHEVQITQDYPLNIKVQMEVVNPQGLKMDLDFGEMDLRMAILQLAIYNFEPLNNCLTEGKDEAVDHILRRAQKEGSPLSRWPYTFATNLMEVTEDKLGKLVGFMPTVLEGIDLKYAYQSTQDLPELSFLVKRL